MQYKVKKGESLSLIAKNNALPSWHTIYDDPKNAQFRKKRPNPNLIQPGDELYIPTKKPGDDVFDVATGQTHTFVAQVPRGIWNLKWDPEEATFGKVHAAKLTGDTNLAEGTEVNFHLHDKKNPDFDLPTLPGKVQGQKVTSSWDLDTLAAVAELLELNLLARADSSVACNAARFILHDSRCVAEEVEVGKHLLDKEKDPDEEEREPSEDKDTLQLVASSSFKLKAGYGTKGASVGVTAGGADLGKVKSGKGKDGKELEGKTNTDVGKEAEKAGSLGDLVSKYHTQATFILALTAGGEAKTKTRLKLSHKCQKEHTLSLGGAGSGSLKPAGDSLKLEWKGSASDPVPKAKPTKYTVSGKGCQGEKKELHLEVFPSTSLLLSLKVEAEVGEKEGAPWLSGPAKIMEGLLKVLKITSAEVEPKLKMEGSVSAFFGWREQKDWRVYYAQEVSAELGGEIEVEAKISLVKLVTHLPAKLTEYVGDAYIKVKFTGGLKLEGKIVGKHYPPGSGQQDHHDGEVALIGTIGLGLEVGVDLGKKNNKILSASVSGGLECAVHPGGKLEVEDQKVSLKPTCTIDAGELKLGVKLKAGGQWKWSEWIGEYEKEWKFELWEKQEFKSLEKHEWVIHDGKKE